MWWDSLYVHTCERFTTIKIINASNTPTHFLSPVGLLLMPSGQPQYVFSYYRSLLQNVINKFLEPFFNQMSPVRNPNPSEHHEQGPHHLSLLGTCWLSSSLEQGPHLPSTTWERPIAVGLLLAMPDGDRFRAMKCQRRTVPGFWNKLPAPQKRQFALFSHEVFPCGHWMLGPLATVLLSWGELTQRQHAEEGKTENGRNLSPPGGCWSHKIAQPWNFLLHKMTNPLIALAILSWVFRNLQQQAFWYISI